MSNLLPRRDPQDILSEKSKAYSILYKKGRLWIYILIILKQTNRMEEQIFRMQLLGRESRETRDGN